MRFEERKLGRGNFSGLGALGDQVNEMFSMCHAEGTKVMMLDLHCTQGHRLLNTSALHTMQIFQSMCIVFQRIE